MTKLICIVDFFGKKEYTLMYNKLPRSEALTKNGKEGAMKLYKYTPGSATEGDGYVVALGFFDGVHAAHRIERLSGYEIAGHQFYFFGVCPECKKALQN